MEIIMDKISLLLATKDRPDKLRLCLESIYVTINNFNNIELIIGLNELDINGQEVVKEFINKYNGVINNKIFIFKEPYFLNDKYNYLGHQAANNLILAIADDLQFKTPGWDKIVIDEFEKVPEDKIFLMWINDGAGSPELPRHYIIHKNWMNIVGNYSANCLIHYYSDNWIYEIATKLDRKKYLENIVVDHSSPYLTQNPEDNDELIKKDTNLYFTVDHHTFINTQRYRDYEVELLNKYIKDCK
jgi:hypothetical protein